MERANIQSYFVTTTRGWELGIGAAIALISVRLKTLNVMVARGLTWAGVLTLAGVAFWLPDTLAWPGSAALIPTLATAAVIAGGPAAGASGAVYLIGRPPFRWIGDRSYSLYLWHWPLLVVATAHGKTLQPSRGLLVVAASFIPALLTYRLLESPLHHSRTLSRSPNRALALGAVCTAIGLLAG
jgi:peptidoglycan/LPS O-acetylase OafA/YrhL